MQIKETLASKLLAITLYAVAIGCAGLIISLPFLLDTYMRIFYDVYYMYPGYRVFITAFLMIIGVLGEWIVVEIILMMRTISTGPFVHRNTAALQRAGIIAMVMAALFFGKCLLYITMLTLAFGVMMVVCGLISFTLSGLFRQAVAYREENDLTI